MSPWRLRRWAEKIHHGAVIAYPTDTIWGLGCHPLRPDAVHRLQAIKQRLPGKGLILLSSSPQYLKPYISTATFPSFIEVIAKPYPKPVSWICKASKHCPRWLTGHTDTIAVRVTDHSPLGILCDKLQSPLVSTSANISGRSTVRNSLQAHRHFHHFLDAIIEGFDTGTQQASQIRNLQTGEILRD